jgi:PAS domain S-box-containing protein
MAAGKGAIIEDGHELMARRKDGSLFPVELGISSFVIDNKKRFVGSIRDISVRRRVEQILRDAQAETRKLALVAAHTKAHVIITDSEGVTEWVNDAFSEFTGYSRAEMLGRRPGQTLRGPDTREEDIQAIQSAINSGKPFHGEQINYTKTGRKFWAELNGAPIFSETGKVSNYIIVRTDITERKLLEQERDRNREVVELVIQNVPSAIFLKDAITHRYVLANRVAEQYLGQGPGSLIGKCAQDVLPREIADTIDARDRETIMTRERAIVEEYALDLPGKGRRIHSSARQCILDEQGEPRFLLTVINDVTKHKQMAEQLQQAQKMEAVGKLTGGLAHDFNNLLMIMIGNLEVLIELSKEPEQTALIDSILQAGLRGSDLTKQLLAFSRRQPLQPKRIDVNEQVLHTTQLLRRTLGQDISIELKLDDKVGAALIDPAQFESAVVNIALNARDAMPGGGTLDVQTSHRHVSDKVAKSLGVAAGDYAVVKVSDSGSGIAPELLGRIFEPFFTTKAPGKGTGLGLSMVYGFKKQSKGTVLVASQIGQGTTFELLLPQVAAVEMPALPTQSVPTEAQRRENSTQLILAVDDNPGVRAAAVGHLRALGYRVIEADDGRAALEKLESMGTIALLFTDIIMPGGIDGIQLAKVARAKRPGLKVLYTSGFPGNNAIEDTEMDAPLLTKPYRRQALAEAIIAALAAA